MKTFLFLALAASTALASIAKAEECKYTKGNFAYDSATKVGSSIFIENPRLLLANGTAYIGSFNEENFCKAIGYRSGNRGSIKKILQAGEMIAYFDGEGNLERIGILGNNNFGFVVTTITCHN